MPDSGDSTKTARAMLAFITDTSMATAAASSTSSTSTSVSAACTGGYKPLCEHLCDKGRDSLGFSCDRIGSSCAACGLSDGPSGWLGELVGAGQGLQPRLRRSCEVGFRMNALSSLLFGVALEIAGCSQRAINL